MFHFGENYFRPSRFHGVFVLSIPFLSTKLFWTEALPRIYVRGVWRFPVVRFPFAPLLFSETFLPTKFFDPRSFRKFPLFQISAQFRAVSRRRFLRHLANLFILISHAGDFHLRNFYLYIRSRPSVLSYFRRIRGFAIAKASFAERSLVAPSPESPLPTAASPSNSATSGRFQQPHPRIATFGRNFRRRKSAARFPTSGTLARSPCRTRRHGDTRP